MADVMPTIVSLDEGSGPVLAVKDAGGRLMTAEQIQLGRQRQFDSYSQVAALQDKLTAGDAATVELVLGQMHDEMTRRLSLLDSQRQELSTTLNKLASRDDQIVRNLLAQMNQRLTQRVSIMQGSLDRSDAILAQLQSAKLGAVPVVSKPAPPTIITQSGPVQVGGGGE
jgi:hypothetical protein